MYLVRRLQVTATLLSRDRPLDTSSAGSRVCVSVCVSHPVVYPVCGTVSGKIPQPHPLLGPCHLLSPSVLRKKSKEPQ